MQVEEIRGRRIVPLERVPEEHRDMVTSCFYCSCPKHAKKRNAVAAIAVEGLNHYYGICGCHAEAYPLTEEEKQKRPMLCPDCFPRSIVG